jgi:hypothetical protein
MQIVNFTIALNSVPTVATSIQYETVDGTAIAGVDYVAASGLLTFDVGEVSKVVPISIYDPVGAAIDTAKTFTLSANFYGANALASPISATLSIDDDNNVVVTPSEEGPIIMGGLITNAFHNEIGRGGYFPAESGTSEGQSVGIYGSLLAYNALSGLSDPTAEETAAAAWYKANAQTMLDAIGDGSDSGTMLRQEIPTDPNTLCMLHWLFCARNSFQKQEVIYDESFVPSGGSITIPAASGGDELFKIWRMYPTTSTLLYGSPYSEAYDNDTPVADTSVDLSEVEWTQDASGNVTFDLPSGTDSSVSEWYVIFGVNNAGLIEQGTAFEAYPCWTDMPDGYVACAPDTFRWFDDALEAAILYDDRSGKATDWTNLRNACRRTIIKGADITDLREVLKPLPQFDVIPVSGEPSGMFCYSSHPSATGPSPALQAEGANADWLGYNFFSRHGGSGGTVQPGEFTWTPGNMFYTEESNPDYFNGAIEVTVPDAGDGTAYQVQIGRGFNDEWREGTAYQDPDQFLFVAMTCSAVPATGEAVYVYLSETKAYDGETRWYADISGFSDFRSDSDRAADGAVDETKPFYIMVPRSQFTNKDSSNPTTMPAGTRFENFGISYEMSGGFSSKIVAMRLVSGTTEAAVNSNYAGAVAGAQMPFFPGSHPFATNSYIPQQQFVGWNGSPFHGYQHPDYWKRLESDAEYVHANLTVTDLPVPNLTTGALEYPISATTATTSTAKPKAAMLMEQQLYFLQRATEKHVSLGGHAGLFAHTFVLNTPARMSLGNPTPHTWVYTNDDPNTRWTGYTMRVAEALGHLVYTTTGEDAYEDARAMALDIVMDTVNTLDALWPDLSGVAGTDDAGNSVLWYGLPTDYPAPDNSDGYGGVPTTTYDEPHAAALLLRACYWLKKSGAVTGTDLATVEALGKRCYDYLLMRWHTDDDEWQYTFANFDSEGNGNYYGFWIFEVLITMGLMVDDPSGNPTGVSDSQMRDWLAKQYVWISANTTDA